MRFPDALERTRNGFVSPLPGLPAQIALAPRPRRGWTPGTIPPDARPAAGLILLYPVEGAATLLLTVRARHLPSHQGQVALPGGAVDADETLEAAAMREAREEVGLDTRGVVLHGRLTPLDIPVSGFVLHPVVATVDTTPSFRPDPREVERVLEVPLSVLTDPKTIRVEPWPRPDGTIREVPYFAVDGEMLWGATAMVISEFLALIGEPPDPWRGGG